MLVIRPRFMKSSYHHFPCDKNQIPQANIKDSKESIANPIDITISTWNKEIDNPNKNIPIVTNGRVTNIRNATNMLDTAALSNIDHNDSLYVTKGI
jgi:hypothetical protein